MTKAIGTGWMALLAGAALALTSPAAAADRTASLQPEQVRLVQRALQERGYPVAPTGTWDHSTRRAVGSFQSTNRLSPTGRLDDATARALGFDPSTVTPVSGKRAAQAAGDPAVNCAINNTVDCLPGQ